MAVPGHPGQSLNREWHGALALLNGATSNRLMSTSAQVNWGRNAPPRA